MTPSFGFVLALLLLSPGFSAFAGFYLGGLRSPVRQAPAAPNSFLALTAITFGALASHSVAALAMAANDVLCDTALKCAAVGFEPNFYVELLRARDSHYQSSGPAAAAFLISLCVISGLGLLLGIAAAKVARRFETTRSLIYGWTAELIFTDAHVMSAFVVSDLSSEGTYLGYEGIVRDLKLGADGEVKTITLSDCERFILTISADELERKTADRAMIPFVILEAENIKNIALNPYFYVEALLDEEQLSEEEEEALLDAESAYPPED